MNNEAQIPQSDLSSALMEEKGSADADQFERAEMAEKLVRLISNQSNPLTISIDGEWGSGKTFFLEILQEQLEEREFEYIYFNAWEDDSLKKDPLVAIIGRLFKHFGDKPDYEEVIGEMIKDALLSKVSSFFGINAKSYFEKMSGDSNAVVEEYVAQIKSRETLKSHLKKMGEIIKGEDGKNPPLVFIIDELDRCRPTFAIELLERIKHLFDIEGIVFVFGVNKKELQNTIKSVYGDIDAELYLSRFFNLEHTLPEINRGEFIEHLLEKHEIADVFQNLEKQVNDSISKRTGIYQDREIRWVNFFPQYIILLLSRMNLSLRDIKKALSPIVWSLKNMSENDHIWSGIVFFLMVLRLKNPSLYVKYIENKCHVSEITAFVEGEEWLSYGHLRDDNDRREIGKSISMMQMWLLLIDKGDINMNKLQDNAFKNMNSDICRHEEEIRRYLKEKNLISSSIKPEDIQVVSIRHIVEMIGSIEVDKRDGEDG